METSSPHPPRWMSGVLVLAGLYNLAWGIWVIVWPSSCFDWLAMDPPRYPQLWQCIGMIVGVYGIGYLIAASDPLRHWPIVLVGLLGKVFGPIGFLDAAWHGLLPWRFGWLNVTNDLIWWVPFAGILWGAWRSRRSATGEAVPELRLALEEARTASGVSLLGLSQTSPVLVVFLRHFG